MTTDTLKTLMTAAEVGALFGVTPDTVRRWGTEGVTRGGKGCRGGGGPRVRLAATKVPGGVRFSRAAVDAFLAEINSKEDAA